MQRTENTMPFFWYSKNHNSCKIFTQHLHFMKCNLHIILITHGKFQNNQWKTVGLVAHTRKLNTRYQKLDTMNLQFCKKIEPLHKNPFYMLNNVTCCKSIPNLKEIKWKIKKVLTFSTLWPYLTFELNLWPWPSILEPETIHVRYESHFGILIKSKDINQTRRTDRRTTSYHNMSRYTVV